MFVVTVSYLITVFAANDVAVERRTVNDTTKV